MNVFKAIRRAGGFKRIKEMKLKEMRDEVKPRKLKQVPDSVKNSLPFGRKSGGSFFSRVTKSALTQAKKKSTTGSKIKRSGKYVK